MRRGRTVGVRLTGRPVCRWLARAALLVAAIAIGLGDRAAPLQAQELVGDGDRAPRFLVVAPGASGVTERVDVSRTPVLRRRISVVFRDVTLESALKEIAERSGLQLAYSKTSAPLDRRVRLEAKDITVAAALTEVLLDAQVDVVLSPGGRAMLVRRGAGALPAGAIVGRVTDAKTGEGLVGAEVQVSGTRWRTVTGEDGRYRLGGVEAGSYTLAVRRIGYRRQTQPVTVGDGEEVTVDVALEAVPTQLDEVVTTVTGEQRLRELGHVVGRINADSLVKEAPVSSVSELLTGRVPGLQVFQSQGTVGGEVRVQVRGANSLLLNTEPIVVIDGVRYTTQAAGTAGQFAGPGLAEPTSPLNDLNPNDIESIEVVKGPSAATLYGTDAANGVLVITTKRGRPGPARWNAYARGTRTDIPEQRYPDLYWGWGTVNGVPDNTAISCTLLRLAEGSCTQQDSVTLLPNPLNDPALTLFGAKPRWQYGANVAGGRQDLRYYFSGDFEDATGPIQMPPAIAEQLRAQRGVDELPEEWREPNAFTKLNLRANVSATLGETADLRVNTGYVHSATRSLVFAGRSPYSRGVFTRGPTAPYGDLGGANPAESFAETSTERVDRFFGSANGQWRPASWLATRATIGLDLTSNNRYGLVRRGDAPHDGAVANGGVVDARARQLAITAELGVTATLRRGRLSARTSIGAQYVRNLNDALMSFGRDLPPGGTSIGEAANIESRQNYTETVTLGSYLEETIGLNDRLFLTGALRVDGASAFGRDYDAVVYPKVSTSWLVSEEPFLPRVPGLDELRLRYAYGASGQQPTPRLAQPGFFVDRAIENGAPTPIVRLFALGNPELRPERVREHEFGFDATALGNRVQLGLTWYRRRTVDQIIGVALGPGLGGINTNLGLTTQHGFETEITARVLDTRLLSWDVTWQYGLHRTKLVDLGRGVARPSPAGGWKEGYSLGARFQRPLVSYADANSDGIINFNEVQRGDTAVYAGESTPPRSQTLTTVLGLFERRLRVSALLERRTGFTQIDALRQAQCDFNTCRARVDPNSPASAQAESWDQPRAEIGDFTRLREVTAALDLPTSLTRALRIRSASLALSVRNLALWTDFGGPDPESASVNGIAGGVAVGVPQGRSWTLRLDLGL